MTQDVDRALEPGRDASRRVMASGVQDVFTKAQTFGLADLARSMGIYPFFRAIDVNEGPEAILDGKRVLMFGSNNYLGLTTHPRVRLAATQAIDHYGTSLTGSRLLNGTLDLHRQLERKLAAFLGKEACLVVTTGYQVNLAVIQALVDKQAVLVLDHRAHASLFDAARVTTGETYTFRHGDPGHLEHVLSKLGKDRGALVALEGVFSMDGEIVDLPAHLEVAERYGARVLLDDAHGLGVHGTGGRGTADKFGVTDRIDLILGTFSKSLASIGGFVAGPARVIEYIQHFGRSFVFTAALPPASTAAAMASLDLLLEQPELTERLQSKIARYRSLLAAAGFALPRDPTPIVPIVVGDEAGTARMWRELLDCGVYVNAALQPAVPRGHSLLRTSVMATHEDEHITRAVDILSAVARRQGVLR